MYAIGLALALVKALRRKDWRDLFEIVPLGIVGVFVTTDLLRPQMHANHSWYVRGLLFVASALFLANMFGFSGWLFGRGRTSAT